jgi:hypothetical protein
MLLTAQRRALGQPWIWLGGAVAALVFLPNVLWNVRHGWPFFEVIRNIRASGRDVVLTPGEYLGHQVLIMNPATLPVWLAGLGYLIFTTRGRPYRALAWAFLLTLATFVLTHGKDYYVTPAFATLFAAGAVAIESVSERAGRHWLRAASFVLLLASLPLVPGVLPILPPERLGGYLHRLGIAPPASERAHAAAALPHHFAWQFGWDEMVAAVASAYHALPPDEQARAAVVGNNYGESGAVDLLGPKYGLPLRALGVHQSYWLWGPGPPGKDVLIVLGDRPETLRRFCGDVQVVAELDPAFGAVWEKRPVLVCRRPRLPLQQAWPRLKKWG